MQYLAIVVVIVAACRTPTEPDPGASIDAAISRPHPDGPDLGAIVTDRGVTFRVWAPHAHAAYIAAADLGADPVAMTAAADGVWELDAGTAHAGTVYHVELDDDAGRIQRVDPYCRELDSAPNCVVKDPAAFAWHDDRFTPADHSHSVVYELHVGSFAATDTTHGTFASTRARLAELADLGVDVIELMPVQAFGGNDTSWGYNPQLYFAPKASYGPADELRALVDEAHQLGIAVWIDVVYNHCDGYRGGPLVCYDGYCPNNAWGVHFFPPGDNAETPWGPRPNYAEPRVATMLRDSVAEWIGEYHGDGFRWDSVSNIRAHDGNGTIPGGRELLIAANDLTHRFGGLSVAEDLKGYGAITQTTANGGFGFDAQWDGFGYDVVNLLAPPSDDGRDLGVVEGTLRGGFDRLLWTENHDTVGNNGARLPVRIDGGNPESFAARRRSMIAAALLLTSPGVPMLFMGQEGLARTGFPDPPPPLPAPTDAGRAVRAFYKDLIALRRNTAGGAGGLAEPDVDILHRNDATKVIAYRRSGSSGQDVIVVLNLRNRAYTRYDVGVPDGGTWQVRINSDWTTYGADFAGADTAPIEALDEPRDGKPYALPLPLGAYGVIVLTR